MPLKRRRVCFVTGTRAEFGLMRTTLQAIARQKNLQLQIIATGMHLDRAHGRSVDLICKEGWKVDATVNWPRAKTAPASAGSTGRAMAGLAAAFERLSSDIVLVVGDRVEAFAAAAAGHVSGRVVAHVHGGDRALGQIDDSLRHAITKLAHVHFAATAASAKRIIRLGEDPWRVHRVGAPGIDGICQAAANARDVAREFATPKPGRFALLILHPTTHDDAAEYRTARIVFRSILATAVPHVMIVHPNNDPGGSGIARCWDEIHANKRAIVLRDIPRGLFLGLMRDAAVMVGNSLSGIIEAASFATPVIDIGDRQAGRERSENVLNVPVDSRKISGAIAKLWNDGQPTRSRVRNVYGGESAGVRIASILARLSVDDRLLRKLIAY